MSEIDQLQKDVDAAIATHSAASPVPDGILSSAAIDAGVTTSNTGIESGAGVGVPPDAQPPLRLRLHLTVDVGNINAGVKAAAQVWAAEINGLQNPVIRCSGETPRAAAAEALRQIEAAVAEYRSTIENDANWL